MYLNMKHRALASVALLLPIVRSEYIAMSNDDGWAELQLRQFYHHLQGQGHTAWFVAPNKDRSGTGSDSGAVLGWGLGPNCQYDSCPGDDGWQLIFHNVSDSNMNWAKAHPADCMDLAVDRIAWDLYQRDPDLAVSGPNLGPNLGKDIWRSGTIGAAVQAIRRGIPAIAFSASDKISARWDSTKEKPIAKTDRYATWAAEFTDVLIKAGKPYLPAYVWLNVNFPHLDSCPDDMRPNYVMSMMRPHKPFINGDFCDKVGNPRYEKYYYKHHPHVLPECYGFINVGTIEMDNATPEIIEGVYETFKDLIACKPTWL